MVVKFGGITAHGIKVKGRLVDFTYWHQETCIIFSSYIKTVAVSGMWQPLSSLCSSCGLAVEELPGSLMLSAPYNRGQCIETQVWWGPLVVKNGSWSVNMHLDLLGVLCLQEEKYLLSLLLAEVELLVTCPSSPNSKPTTTAVPPTDRPVLQYPQYPQFPVFPQYPPGTVAPLLQHPQLPSGASTDTGNQASPAAQHPAFSFMPQYPQFPQYPLFPRPVPPMKPPAAPPAQLPQMPQSPQYPFPFFPQFPMVPGIFHPTPPPPPASVTTPALTTKRDGKPVVPLQTQFPIPPQYPFLPFHPLPQPPEGQTQPLQGPKPVIHQHKPYQVYPQTYQIPVLYPPQKYPPQRQNTQTAALTTASATSSGTALKPVAQQPFYYPHPYMSAYYVPQPAPKPDPPTAPPVKPAPSNQHKRHPPVFHSMSSFYPFPSHHMPKSVTKNS